MCGLTGFLAPPGGGHPEPRRVAAAMAEALRHRGPDSGVWCDAAAGIALGHRRLAIIDLSPLGAQPMASASGRWVTAYNGEIYNYPELRAELEGLGTRFRGHSDTEVMLAALDRWGLAATLPRLAGMFAMALWDREERRLHLVRDRLGKKPLYVALCRGSLLFGSELKALRAFPGFAPGLDRAALALFLRYSYVPDPYCILEGALKVPPGGLLSLRAGDLEGATAAGLRARVEHYWSLPAVAEAGQADALRLGDGEAADELDRLLRQATTQRMLADVPLGAFLSGGIDSSAVVAAMQAGSSRPVRTFTIGFPDAAHDEAPHARAVAAHLGTEHTEVLVSPAEAQGLIPELPDIYDEPFADASQVPTCLVSRLARRQVTVALSGDGGDETFGGYSRYLAAAELAGTRGLPVGHQMLGPVPGADGLLSDRPADKIADALSAADERGMYARFVTQWHLPAELMPGVGEPPMPAFARLPDFASRAMAFDSVTYLPGCILAKVDRASMAVGLEVRAPLLDHRLVEFAWRLPLSQKLRHGEGKWLLRRVLARHVPAALFERPKMGFSIPLDAWLRGPLRDWAEDLLGEQRLRSTGLLRPEPVRERWRRHLAGSGEHGFALWNLLMFQAWQARWG